MIYFLFYARKQISEMDCYDRVIREPILVLDNLCGREMNESGREYIRNRIKAYEKLRDEDRIFKDTVTDKGVERDR